MEFLSLKKCFLKKEYEMEKKYFLEMKKHDFNILKVYPFLPKDIWIVCWCLNFRSLVFG